MRPVPENFEMMDEEMVPVLRAMTGAQRLAIANRMFQEVQRTLGLYVASQNPSWTPEEVQREVARWISQGSF